MSGRDYWPDPSSFASPGDCESFYAALDALGDRGDVQPLVGYLKSAQGPLSPGLAKALAHILSGEPVQGTGAFVFADVSMWQEPAFVVKIVEAKRAEPDRMSFDAEPGAAREIARRVRAGEEFSEAFHAVRKECKLGKKLLQEAVSALEDVLGKVPTDRTRG